MIFIFKLFLGHQFKFPREENKRLGTNQRENIILPTTEEVQTIIQAAKQDALIDCKDLNMNFDEEQLRKALQESDLPYVASNKTEFNVEIEDELLDEDDVIEETSEETGKEKTFQIYRRETEKKYLKIS